MALFFKSWATIDDLRRYRVAKYKQRRQLNHTFERGVKFFNENDALAKGACTALCRDWIMNGMGGTPETRLSNLIGQTYFAGAVAFATAMNRGGADGYERTQLEFAIREIGKTRAAYIVENNFGTFENLRPHLIGHDGHHMMFMKFVPTARIRTGHVVAAYTHGGIMNFFDPNSGEYQVGLNDGALTTFFRALVRQYETYVFAERTWLFFSDAQPVRQREWYCHSMT